MIGDTVQDRGTPTPEPSSGAESIATTARGKDEGGSRGVVAAQSFARFIYPFRFPSADFHAHRLALDEATWSARDRSFKVWERPEPHTAGMLDHVAAFFNTPPDISDSATALHWRLRREALTNEHGLWGKLPWEYRTRAMAEPRPFHIEGVELALFNTGVGFLTLDASPDSTSLDDWLDFISTFRFLWAREVIQVRAIANRGTRGEKGVYPAPGGTAVRHDELGYGRFSAILEALLRTGGPEPSGNARWWSDVYTLGQLFPFVGLYADGHPHEDIPHLIYRVRHFFCADQGDFPAPEDLRLEDTASAMAYAERQWFVFSLDGGAFVACDAPDSGPQGTFFRQTLPGHLVHEYFLLLLIVLHQYFALMMLSEEVARQSPLMTESAEEVGSAVVEEREQTFDRLRAELLAFTARGYFAQVAQGHHHHRFYRRWQETLQIGQLYREVRDEVREVHDHLLLRRARRGEQLQEEAARQDREVQERVHALERRIGRLALLLGGPGLALTYVSATGTVSRAEGAVWAVAGLVVGAVLVTVFEVIHRVRVPKSS